MPTRDDLASEYLDTLLYPPYPVQEEALLAWFTSKEGVMVSAPTGTGKTLIAEAVLFEALKSGTTAYYTTPLIALTEQKFDEIKASVVRWGYSEDDVGLVTGNRKVNPQAKILVVVAEILLNRLLHGDEFDFDHVSGVVMDEFHSFSDPSRGVVWELSLALLPSRVRLMLLSATVGNALEFLGWLRVKHGRHLELVQGTERKVPLNFKWIPDQFLDEQLEIMADGDDDFAHTPALVFCFSRAECWSIADQLRGKTLVSEARRKILQAKVNDVDFSTGAGPKLKQILMRGIGVHHAGIMPKYRRIVEELFQQKLLAVLVCTETLAAGMNLPARSVVMTTIVKGPKDRKKLIEPSTAHQIFGRAGRPQYDTQGYVYALAHEDDVKLHRWKQKYDQIPEDTKDPNLIKAKKAMKKKMPTKNANETYWTEAQLTQLREAAPSKLVSRGVLPWRLLAYLLSYSHEVEQLRGFVRKRLLDPKAMEREEKQLVTMLTVLHREGYITLTPPPPEEKKPDKKVSDPAEAPSPVEPEPVPTKAGLFGQLLTEARQTAGIVSSQVDSKKAKSTETPTDTYFPTLAEPTEKMQEIFAFRSIDPIYGNFLLKQFDIANEEERLQAMESLLELSVSVAKLVRVPRPDRLPIGPLAQTRLDEELLSRGLVTAEQLRRQYPSDEPEDFRSGPLTFEDFAPPLADKLKLLFHSEYPRIGDLAIMPCWCIGELLKYNGEFDKYIRANDLVKEEGSVFRHALRMILLCGEFQEVTPSGWDTVEWRNWLSSIVDNLTKACHSVDPQSTDKWLAETKEEFTV